MGKVILFLPYTLFFPEEHWCLTALSLLTVDIHPQGACCAYGFAGQPYTDFILEAYDGARPFLGRCSALLVALAYRLTAGLFEKDSETKIFLFDYGREGNISLNDFDFVF